MLQKIHQNATHANFDHHENHLISKQPTTGHNRSQQVPTICTANGTNYNAMKCFPHTSAHQYHIVEHQRAPVVDRYQGSKIKQSNMQRQNNLCIRKVNKYSNHISLDTDV